MKAYSVDIPLLSEVWGGENVLLGFKAPDLFWSNILELMIPMLKYFWLQVNQCQKLSFLNQLTHNMKTDCSLN